MLTFQQFVQALRSLCHSQADYIETLLHASSYWSSTTKNRNPKGKDHKFWMNGYHAILADPEVRNYVEAERRLSNGTFIFVKCNLFWF